MKNGNGTAVGGTKMDEEEERDAVFFRLEMLGYRVGQGLVERYVLLLLPLFFISLCPDRGSIPGEYIPD